MRALKRIGCLAVAVTLMILLKAPDVCAVEIRISPPSVKAGGTVEFPVMVDRVENLAGIKLVLKYDPDLLTFKKAQKSRQTTPLMHIVNDRNPGRLVVVMAGAMGIKGEDFPLMILTFGVKEGIEKNTQAAIEVMEIQMMSERLKEIQTAVKVSPVEILAAEPIETAKKESPPASEAETDCSETEKEPVKTLKAPMKGAAE